MELKPWQKVVDDFVKNHDEVAGSEQYQSSPDYNRNIDTAIRVRLPKGSGHTAMSAWLTEKYAAMLIYSSHEHLKEINDVKYSLDINENANSWAISAYEIYYAIQENGRNAPSLRLQEIKDKMHNNPPKVIVVDNASAMPTLVIDFVLQLTNEESAIVMLG